jgi:tRNA(Phe) wybutosine-synthesizing methylase Tyw3
MYLFEAVLNACIAFLLVISLLYMVKNIRQLHRLKREIKQLKAELPEAARAALKSQFRKEGIL